MSILDTPPNALPKNLVETSKYNKVLSRVLKPALFIEINASFA